MNNQEAINELMDYIAENDKTTISIETVRIAITALEKLKAVDAVLNRLEEVKTKRFVSGITANPYEFGACHAIDMAIEIIKEQNNV